MFEKVFEDVININNIDVYLGVPDFILAVFLNKAIQDLKTYIDSTQTEEKAEVVRIADFGYDCIINLKAFNENLEHYNDCKTHE